MPRVAVVGSGVAGLVSAYTLHRAGCDVVLYEKDHRLGGHAHTQQVHGVDVDTGFMVLNHITYPNLLQLFDELGVETVASDMSFAVSLTDGIEWGSDSLSALFAQRTNAVSPAFWCMIYDMTCFQKDAERFLGAGTRDSTLTLGAFARSHGYSATFIDAYLVPMCASIWSVQPKAVLEFPAHSILLFMRNHSLLQLTSRPQWLGVKGRSIAYVEKITAPLRKNIRLGTAVTRVDSVPDACAGQPRVRVHDATGAIDTFDDVILAAHAPDSLALLGETATPAERSVLQRYPYKDNVLYLHSDPSLMPASKACWSAWNFLGSTADGVYLSYYLNRLQNLSSPAPIIVTLNPPHPPAQHLTHSRWHSAHPVPTLSSAEAQPELDALQGNRGIWFAGAWQGWGFHEDGARSALDVAHRLLGRPWRSLPYAPTFRPSWTEAAARELSLRHLAGFFQQGQVELYERGGRAYTFGKPSTELRTARLMVNSPAFYTSFVSRADLGFADAWIAGDISGDLIGFLLLCIKNRDLQGRSFSFANVTMASLLGSYRAWRQHRARHNNAENAQKNISAHYDLSNQLFALFLDPSMTYSSAYFRSPDDTLEQAQLNKLEMLASKLQAAPGHRVLEIGSGWGSLAMHLARTRGCRITSLTLSKEQKELAEQRVRAAGLADRIEFVLCDYRVFADKNPGLLFDRIVSCEMLEAVGREYYGAFFAACDKMLAPNGLMVIQTIAIPDQRFEAYANGVDFIQERIFPGGCLPCISVLTQAMRDHSTFGLENLQNLPLHYARTLQLWRERFHANRARLEELGFDVRFQRTWDYYFEYCRAGFLSCTLQLLQLVFTRAGNTACFTLPEASRL